MDRDSLQFQHLVEEDGRSLPVSHDVAGKKCVVGLQVSSGRPLCRSHWACSQNETRGASSGIDASFGNERFVSSSGSKNVSIPCTFNFCFSDAVRCPLFPGVPSTDRYDENLESNRFSN